MSKDWTDELRERLADYQEPVKDDLWAGIEQSLAQQEGKHSDVVATATMRQVFIRRFSMAAAVAALAVGGTYVYLHPWGQSEVAKVGQHVEAKPISNVKGESQHLLAQGGQVERQVESVPSVAIRYDKEVLGVSHEVSVEQIPAEELVQSTAPSASGNEKKADRRVAELTTKAAATSSYAMGTEYPQVSGNRKTHRFSAFSVKVYGENGLVGNSEFNNRPMLAKAPQSDPIFGEVPDLMSAANANGPLGTNVLVAGTQYSEKVEHHQPLSVGMQVGFAVSPRLKLTTGLVYTKVSSDFIGQADDNKRVTTQTLHYVGVPLDLSYYVWGTNRFHTYLTVGGEGAVNVKNNTEMEGEKMSSRRDRMQWSVHAAIGAQYDIVPQLGIYVEPGVKNYFDNGSKIENVFKDKKLNVNFQFGLRWNIGKSK